MRAACLLLVAALAGCVSSDVARATETLRGRGFRQIGTATGKFAAPAYHGCTELADSCTHFEAIAPWGWPVAGSVECSNRGTCTVRVEFK